MKRFIKSSLGLLRTDPLAGLLFILSGILAIRPLVDPDYGWHYRNGLDILKNSALPYLDPYSYTMPDWQWVNHEWLTDIILAILHQTVSPLGLSILFGILAGVTFYIATGTHIKTESYRIIASALGVLAALPILGVRPQVISLFGLALVLMFVYAYQRKERKNLWLLVPFFLIWANLHGAYTMGLFALFIFFIAEVVKYAGRTWVPTLYSKCGLATEPFLKSKALIHVATVGLLSGVVTLINPYGWRLYHDIYLTLSNEFALSNIGEWQKVSLESPIVYNYLAYVFVFVILVIFAYRKVEFTRWVLMGTFLYLSLLHWRNMPLFMVVSVGLVAEILAQQTHLVYEELSKNRLVVATAALTLVLLLGQRVVDVGPRSFDDFNNLKSDGYPIEAIEWAKNHPGDIGDHVFNEYGWGGTLVWKMPEKKVFQDGRMSYWVKDNRFPFFHSQHMLQAQLGTLELLDQYNVDWTLIRRGQPLEFLLLGQKDWKLVYADPIAVIYTKNKNEGE